MTLPEPAQMYHSGVAASTAKVDQVDQSDPVIDLGIKTRAGDCE
ncbi:MAG TPA: hypothetical protein VMT20_27740 [Terriglobia bacterium]|nr:hypothetical protein [Terriglobia bacterium]